MLPPSTACCNQLLFDLLCQPVSIRIERLAPLARALHAGQPPLLADLPAAGSEDPLPWECPLYTVEGGIAILTISGTMVKGCDAFTCWLFGLASIDRLQLALAEISARDDVAAVVLNIDSGGGMTMGTPELGDAVAALAAQKFVVAFTSGMACSAAYWTACAASLVVSTRSAMVGSIGTFIAVYDFSEMFADMGIKVDVIKRGAFKGMFTPGTSLTDEQRAWLDAQIGRINDSFTSFVRAHRGAVADSTMQGQWFDGEQAVALGLVDRVVSGLPEVLATLRASLNQSIATARF